MAQTVFKNEGEKELRNLLALRKATILKREAKVSLKNSEKNSKNENSKLKKCCLSKRRCFVQFTKRWIFKQS